MKEAIEFEDECEVEDVPVSPLLSVGRRNRYGSVPGLDDEELASPEELEREVFLEEWGPVLMLPVRGRRSPVQPSIDEYFGVDWGAFASVDFARGMPEFDKARYKAARLREELRDVLIMMQTISDRLPKAKGLVLELVRTGVIDLEHIQSEDMYELARRYLRAERLRWEIRRLGRARTARLRERLAKLLG